MRLVHGESDGLPGVVADRYGDVIVLQMPVGGRRALARGASRPRWRTRPARAASTSAPTPRCARSKACTARRALASARCRRVVTIVEDGIVYGVDVVGGQKTGFYLDQRDNRAIVRAHATGRAC